MGSNGRTHKGASVKFTPVWYQSNSNEVLRVQLEDSSNQDEVCFSVHPCTAGDMIFYQVINNYYAEQQQSYSCPSKGSKQCFTTNPLHAPMSMIIAYKVEEYKDNKELISASVKFSKAFATRQDVQLSVTPSTQEPGGDVTVLLNTSRQAMAGLIGVDKSVELLGDPNDLTLKEIENAVTAYRPFENERKNPYPNPPILFRGPAIAEDAVQRRKKRSLCWGCGGFYTRVDAGTIIQEAGLKVITDIPIVSNPNERDHPWLEDRVLMFDARPRENDMIMRKGEESADGAVDDGTAGGEEEEEPARVRTNFQEVWLWNLVQTDASGLYSLTKAVPDTITSWNVKAFAFNTENGLGVASPVQLTVYQDFFVYMNLPYAVVRGERFDLQILVFNYMDTAVQVQVELDPSESFDVITANRQRDQLLSQSLTVQPGSSGVAVVPISPTQVGDLLLRASATDKADSSNVDIVERTLIVKAEGYQVSDSLELSPVKFPAGAGEKIVSMSDLLTRSNIEIVDDSFRLDLSVTGDMMGPFIANLEGQTRMPTGCGEQNIKTLAPSVLVAMYLKAINRFSGDIKNKCQKYAGTGYIRQLRYKHTEGESMGGYSAWGQHGACTCRGEAPDPNPGSTWLTAFVLRMFSMLAQQDLTYVSMVPLQQAFDYLKRKAEIGNGDTFFIEEGHVIHTEMQGGTSAGIGLTAFCSLALMDLRDVAVGDSNTDLVTDIDSLLDPAAVWLRGKYSYLVSKKKPYQLAITAYALAKHSKVYNDQNYQSAMSMLEAYETLKDSVESPPMECPYIFGRVGICQETSDLCSSNTDCSSGQLCCNTGCSHRCMDGRMPYHSTGPTKTEMTGYALMAYTSLAAKTSDTTKYNELKAKVEALASWLLERRKAGGNFESTQDTVVALEALTRRSIQFVETTQTNFRVKAKAGNQDVSEWLDVTSDNYIISQSVKLDVSSSTSSLPSEIKLVYEGTLGTAFTTVEATYNTLQEKRTSPFHVDVYTYTNTDNAKVVEICVNNRNSSESLSSMVVVSVECGSGLMYDGVPSFDPKYKVSKVEYDGSECQVTWYYDVDREDNFVQPHCYKFAVLEDFEVFDRKPGSIAVRDYYNVDNNAEYTFMADFSASEPTTKGPTTGASQIQLSFVAVLVATMLALIFAVYRQ